MRAALPPPPFRHFIRQLAAPLCARRTRRGRQLSLAVRNVCLPHAPTSDDHDVLFVSTLFMLGTCQAGASGSVGTATATSPYYSGTGCTPVTCPNGTIGTNVISGCICNNTLGVVLPLAIAPYYNNTCSPIVKAVGQIAYTTPGTYTFTVPSFVTQISIVCVGGGGGAMAGITNLPYSGGSGGGGGALAYSNGVPVTTGSTVSITVGAGGLALDAASPYTGNPGSDSFVTYNTAVILRAGGGGAGIASSTTTNPAGAGGQPSGTLLSGGGAGGAGGSVMVDNVGGGGGG
eukprot:m.259310 g.259310  ORF g.259310 m.259310 type:complete len:289 (+) comp22377_c0_seq1:597-1463(+)